MLLVFTPKILVAQLPWSYLRFPTHNTTHGRTLTEGHWYASQQTKEGSWPWPLKLPYNLHHSHSASFWQVRWSCPMSSFWTMFGIFLLLTDSVEMGPDCRPLSCYFPVLVEIIELLVSLANSWMAPTEWDTSIILHHLVLEFLWGCSKKDLFI